MLLPAYKQNITAIVDKTTAAGIKVIILTATMIGEDQPMPITRNSSIITTFSARWPRSETCRWSISTPPSRRRSPFLRAQPGMADRNQLITVDGVHMNPTGDQMMATGILTEGFGFTPDQMDQARVAWLDLVHPVTAHLVKGLTERDYQRIVELARSQNRTPDDVLDEAFQKSVDSLVSTLPPETPQTLNIPPHARL